MPYVVPDKIKEPLYTIVPYFNPFRWKSREKHTIRAIKHFQDSGAVVVLVEAAFNRREFAFADSGLDGTPAQCGILGSDHRFRHKYIALRTKDELWLKENLINVAVAHLPYDWHQAAWLDSDVHFLRPNWVGECIHKLQHFAFLQMFSHARDLHPNYEMLPEKYPHADGRGFIKAWNDGIFEALPIVPTIADKHPPHPIHPPHPPHPYSYQSRIWPGLAWACTRQAWDAVGGLMDFAVWGGGDYHTAHCLIEHTDGMMRNDLHPSYQNLVMAWYEKCHTHIRKNIGCMTGSVVHHWHGMKTSRGYNAKHKLLADIGFDPVRHLKRDYQGLYQLHDDGSDAFVSLRDMMRKVSNERNEDTNDPRIDLYEQGH